MNIKNMNEQQLVNFALGDIQSACNIPPIAMALRDVTIRLRDLGLNGNDHIAIKWIIDKLYSLVNRDVNANTDHEKNLVDNYFKKLHGEVFPA